MKVFDLACDQDHRFEGWFASADDYDGQLARGLLECPMCASRSVRKLPTAPHLNLSGAAERPAPVAPSASAPARSSGGAPDPRAVQAMIMKVARALVANTEDVGERFVDEARRIHHGEAPERGIRGTASPEQARELADEGIEVFSFPLPAALKEPLQ
ncbi:MAG TPA: DUF1178 family protein [Burkholderiaceae bacterium]|nr:DUF1178 family protein [Burkholderiaceae bacterium]